MLISMEHITKHQNVKCIVDDIDLAIEDHDKIALIGVNGTGKTTLLRIIAGEETYETGTIIKKNGLRISYLPQAPVFEKGLDILHQILVLDKEIQEFEAKAILNKLGMQTMEAKIEELSGGQKKRVALARALLNPCDLLILDEPTNHLDNEMIEWLEKYLIKSNRALLMVTHDRYFLERICDKIVEIDQTKLYTYEANYSTFLELKAQREEMALSSEKKRQNILRKELAWMRAGVQARGTKSKERIDRFHKLNDMGKIQDQKNVTLDTITSRLGKKTIEIEGVSKCYGKRTLFHDFSYQMTRNDRIGILGVNGCGKSTLLHILSKELQPDEGEVVHGETVRLAYFKQGHEDMDMSENVIDYIRDTSNEVKTAEGTYSASQMLERFLFPKKMQYTPIGRLSGGERRRLYLLKVLMQAPNILFLDEPTNDLDIATLQILEDYLDDFNGAIIVVSHDRYFLDRICDKLFVFQGGNIKQFIGGYSTYIELDQSNTTTVKKEEKPRSNVSVRMSTKEKQELEHMESNIEKVQQNIDEIDVEMAQCGDDFVRLQNLSEQRIQLEESLEEMMDRWMYLTDLKDSIEATKRK
ncbi:ABC-F family ATP-binding cassette domain-containing protein [Amedibacillus sp. YH-ame6]